MDKPAIKKFAVWARNKLIADTKYRAGLVGVTETAVAEPLPQSNETVQFFDVGLPQPYRIEGDAVAQRQRFVAELNKETAKQGSYTAAYQTVVDKVAYTWFNRLIAVRYMEVNALLPSRTRVLSSADGRAEPQIVTSPFDAVLDYTPAEQQQIAQLKNDNQLDEAFRLLFLKQCAALGDCLPRLFEQVDDYMPLLLALSFTDKDGVVCHLVNDIPESDWLEEDNKGGAVQIVGWLYQYYNTEPKEQVFANLKKNIKISAENIPAATQLFTPDWIVRYMVENSLGRLWSEGHPDFDKSEWKYYLDEAPQEPQVVQQLAELRKGYAALTPEDIKCIDPCMGSGHILAYLFDVLMQIYRSAGYSDRDAAASIVEHNLYGLDIDDRAAQMAYFVVMMKGCHYDSRFLRRHLNPHVYAIQESGKLTTDALGRLGKQESTARALLDGFKNAKEYGSILQPKVTLAELDTLQEQLREVDGASIYGGFVTTTSYFCTSIRACSTSGHSTRSNCPATNWSVKLPMSDGSGMDAHLSDFVKKNYPDTKSDMSTVCMERTLNMCNAHGYMAMINIPVWMFLSSYEKLREKMLRENTIVSMVHPGRGIFGSDFGTTSFVIAKAHLQGYKGHYRRLFDKQGEVESVEQREQRFFEKRGVFYATQDNFFKIPGSPVAYWVSDSLLNAFVKGTYLGALAESKQGLATADNNRFLRLWYEVENDKVCYSCKNTEESKNDLYKWYPYNKGGEFRKWYGNNDYIVNWENDGFEIRNFTDGKGKVRSRPQNTQFYFRESFSWSLVSSGVAAFRYKPTGHIFDVAGMSCFAPREKLFYLLALCNTKVVTSILEIVAPTINYQCGDIANIPVIGMSNKVIGETVEKNIAVSKSDWDSFETSWDFKKHPLV